MARQNLLFVIVGVVATSCLVKSRLPNFITEVCYADDVEVEQCLLRLATAYLDKFTDGVPDFNIPSLSPAVIKEITIRSPGFNLTFDDSKLYGLKNTVFKKFKFDLPNRKVSINFDCDLTLRSIYDVSGRISVVKIEGHDKAVIKVKSNVDIIIDYGKRNGAWKILDRSFNYTVNYAHFDINNLFNGKQEVLAKAAVAFLNQSWQLVMTDIAPPAITQIVDAIIVSINRFLMQTSPDELFHIPKGFKY